MIAEDMDRIEIQDVIENLRSGDQPEEKTRMEENQTF